MDNFEAEKVPGALFIKQTGAASGRRLQLPLFSIGLYMPGVHARNVPDFYALEGIIMNS